MASGELRTRDFNALRLKKTSFANAAVVNVLPTLNYYQGSSVSGAACSVDGRGGGVFCVTADFAGVEFVGAGGLSGVWGCGGWLAHG
jgi:hypothetical protein